MASGASSAQESGRTVAVLTVLLAALVGSIWIVPYNLAGAQNPDGLKVLPAATTAIAIAALVGAWLHQQWSLWCALIAVAFAATIVAFAYSQTFDVRLLAVAGVLIAATSVLIFNIGRSQGETVGRYQRILFGAVFAFAGWVAFWGWIHPTQIGQALPLNVTPLHARFLGAMYLSGCSFMLLAMVSRAWNEIAIVVVVLAIWTGMLGLVSALNMSAFDWLRYPTWFWSVAYLAFPLIAAWIAWCQRHQQADAIGKQLRPAVRGILFALGGVATVAGAAMLFAPRTMVTLWPWAIPPLLAQIYSAPFLAYGIGCLLAARRRSWPEVRITVLGTLIFVAGALAASYLHAGVFNAALTSSWVWFGGFGLAAIALLTIAALSSVRVSA